MSRVHAGTDWEPLDPNKIWFDFHVIGNVAAIDADGKINKKIVERFSTLLVEPVLVTARFSPQNSGIRIDQLDLVIPDLPVTAANFRKACDIKRACKPT